MNGEVTGEIIKSAISLKIKDTFKTGEEPDFVYPTIYKEEIIQNLSKPYFFIWTLDVGSSKLTRNVYEMTYQMQIRYHGADKAPKEYQTHSDIGIKLMEALRLINVPIWNGEHGEEITLPVWGKQVSFKTVDGVLQFFVTYVIRAKIVLSPEEKLEQGAPMGTLTLNLTKKE